MHFGRQPYEWLAPLLNVPWVTFLINVNYNIWFFVMFTCWYWQGFAAKDTALRVRILFGFHPHVVHGHQRVGHNLFLGRPVFLWQALAWR